MTAKLPNVNGSAVKSAQNHSIGYCYLIKHNIDISSAFRWKDLASSGVN